MSSRASPFELVFGGFREHLERVRQVAEAAGPLSRDAFLLQQPVAELLRELRPEEGLGPGMEALAGLVHQAYLFWANGERVRVLTPENLAHVLQRLNQPGSVPAGSAAPAPRSPAYVQLPHLSVWGRLDAGPPEPLDGWFVHGNTIDDAIDVLAVLGVHPGGAGFTAVEVSGRSPLDTRPIHDPRRFAPITSETGTGAGLAAIGTPEDLLELAWLVEELP